MTKHREQTLKEAEQEAKALRSVLYELLLSTTMETAPAGYKAKLLYELPHQVVKFQSVLLRKGTHHKYIFTKDERLDYLDLVINRRLFKDKINTLRRK